MAWKALRCLGEKKQGRRFQGGEGGEGEESATHA
jgi:hypothetical protein